jgi:hypothetical protein
MSTVERWIYRRENRAYRIGFIILSLILSLLSYFWVGSIIWGTFFLFMLSYFSGAFKGRKRIEVIHNENMESAIAQLARLLATATKNISILCGSANPIVYNNKDILCAFERAKSHGVDIKLFTNFAAMKTRYGRYTKQEFDNSILAFIADRRIELYSLDKDVTKMNHFAVVDRKSFRVEQKHGSDTTRKAIVVFHNKRGRRLHDALDNVTTKPFCRKIDSDEIRSTFLMDSSPAQPQHTSSTGGTAV